MRCYICDTVVKDPEWNRDHEDWEPCPTCVAEIQDVLESWKDRPFADDDELSNRDDLPDFLKQSARRSEDDD